MVRFTRSSEQVEDPLIAPLFDDLVELEETIQRQDSQFARRALIRAAFAFIEGYMYSLREPVFRAIAARNFQTNRFEITKLSLLLDATGRVDDKGRIKSEPNRMPFLNHCAFIFRCAAEHNGQDPSERFSDHQWDQLRKAIKIRDRITHPKQPKDLEITDADIEATREGCTWVFNTISWLTKHSHAIEYEEK